MNEHLPELLDVRKLANELGVTRAAAEAKSGPRFAVRYRLGERYHPLRHAGSFRTLRDARKRLNLVRGQRWLAVPDELLDEIGALVPVEDRHRDRRVFPNLTDMKVRTDLERACRDGGIAAYPPTP